jgi:hypothetical protein
LSLGRRLAFVILLAFSVSVARADQAGPPDDPSAHVFNYGKAHPQCARWTDGCRTCAADGCSEYRHCMPAERNPLSARCDKTARDRRRQP